MSEKIERLARDILELTAREFVELNWLVVRGGGDGIPGAREPKRPRPPRLPDAGARRSSHTDG